MENNPKANITNISDNQALAERIYSIAIGKGRFDTDWINRDVTWNDMTTQLTHCKRTRETVAEYRSMSRTQKGAAKDQGGFVGGSLESNGPRKAQRMTSRSLITLDIDEATTATVLSVEHELIGTAWILYSTHSHTPERPRFRLVVPLSRDVTPQEYGAISRQVAARIDIDTVDEASFRVHQLMYWPSCPKDGEYVFEKGEGRPLDADAVLNTYRNWADCAEWPRSSRTETQIRATTGAKAEDPTGKPGIVGDFCRAYSMTSAISTFLADVYEPTALDDRFTFREGTTSGGVIIYDDKFAYSHHATDPASGRLCNAFDLVRIHKYGDLDTDAAPETPVSKLPSYLEMTKFARSLEDVAAETSRRNLSRADAVFFGNDEADADSLAGASAGADDVKAKATPGTKPSTDNVEWMKRLEWNQRKGKPDQLANNPLNYATVILNHPDYKGKLAFDLFSNKRVKTAPIRNHPAATDWDETADVAALVQFFAAPPFHTKGKPDIKDAVDYVFTKVPQIHPVREWLNSLPAWDGRPRLDTCIIDYLGAPDTELNRVMTRKHIFAAIRRVFTPGWKHDQVLALSGPQGIGKSTFIRLLFSEKWFDDTSFDVTNAKERTLQTQGKWALELGELTDYRNSTVEAYKAFLSGKIDNIRGLYEKNYKPVPRQFVIWATTNLDKFLKGNTGNRRFWVIECLGHGLKSPFSGELEDERCMIWAEALAKYENDLDTCYLGELEGEANKMQARLNEAEDDVRIEELRAYMDERVPEDWDNMTKGDRYEWHRYKRYKGLSSYSGRLIRRPPVCYQEILDECFPKMKEDRYAKGTMRELFKYAGMEYACNSGEGTTYGKQRRFKLLDRSTEQTEGTDRNKDCSLFRDLEQN